MASVSIYVSAAEHGKDDGQRPPIAHDTEAARLSLRSAANAALAELAEIDIPTPEREAIAERIRELEGDRDFWGTQARSVAVFASPEDIRAFRLMNRLAPLTAVGDRFDVGPLVRASSFAHTGYVLAVTEGDVRLLYLDSAATSRSIELRSLPEDASDVLSNSVTTGRFDRHRADGTLGPKIEQRRYCTIVQDAVLAEIGEDSVPLVLAAAADLDPAYRQVNRYGALLEEGISANPASLSLADLEQRGRAVLDREYRRGLAEWCERFGTQKAHRRAGSNLEAVAKAASAGQVEELLFDIEANDEGVIDEFGAVFPVPEPGPTTYRLVDEIAARVLRTGGRVVAVRRADLPDDSPVASIFRTAVEG